MKRSTDLISPPRALDSGASRASAATERGPMVKWSGKATRIGWATVLAVLVTGCSAFGPSLLESSRLPYNEAVKRTSEEQLLLNVVRLRYTDTPSSLAVSSIAAQFEITKSFQLTPFFVASGAEVARSYAAVLPQLGIAGADRP